MNTSTFSIISCPFVLRIKNISDKSCTETRNTHFIFSSVFRKSCRLWNNVENVTQPGRPQMIIWRMRIACWIPKATNTHTSFVTIIAFPLQQWLNERASLLRCTHIAGIVNWYFKWNNINQNKIWWYQFLRMPVGILLSVVHVERLVAHITLLLEGTQCY